MRRGVVAGEQQRKRRDNGESGDAMDRELRQVKRGVGYPESWNGLPGWDADECAKCHASGFVGKDLEQCDDGHLICDDCVGDDCPLCEALAER